MGRRVTDLLGQRFGRLLVIKRDVNGSAGKAQWVCLCDCGSTKTVRRHSLANGNTTSCGCFRREVASSTLPAKNKARATHGMSSAPEHGAWRNMIRRCTNSRDPWYWHYGMRGIKVCQEWIDSFRAFYDHIGPRPSTSHSLDRIDNDGNYEPGNVRWATVEVQQNNKTQRWSRNWERPSDDESS